MADKDDIDPRELIAESYRIDGITPGECRSIFLDWALGAPDGETAKACISQLIARHEPDAPHHPMTQVLQEALAPPERKGRRGGAAARRRTKG
ncbi:MAG: hypothetical protein HKN27_11640 [Silicimonas sp.]|nr:hypothetical protein [Silicimonas sp.]